MTTEINGMDAMFYYYPIAGTVLSLIAREEYQNYFDTANRYMDKFLPESSRKINRECRTQEWVDCTDQLDRVIRETECLAHARTGNNLWTVALVIAAVATGLPFLVGAAIVATNLALTSWCVYELRTGVANIHHRLYSPAAAPQPA